MDHKRLKVYTASSVGIDYFLFLNKTIANAGFDAEPLYLISEPEYRELSGSSRFKKVWLRVKMYLLYPAYLVYKGLSSQPGSVFIISSNTFFAPALMYPVLKLRGSKVIHMLYDLFPDALEVAGSVSQQSFLSGAIGSVTRFSQKKCDATVYLGEFLRDHAEMRWGKAKISSVIDISTDLSLYHHDFPCIITDEKIVIHYGGQLGHLHDARSLVESVKRVCHSELAQQVEFNFYTSGAQAQYLRDELRSYPVQIISAVPGSQWRSDIRKFHVGLVSLSPAGSSVCLPSKTYGMMAGGLAILAICPEWSDLARLIKSSDAGWVINNSAFKTLNTTDKDYLNSIYLSREAAEIPEDFLQTVRTIVNHRDLLNQKRKNAFEEVRKNYHLASLSAKWTKVILEASNRVASFLTSAKEQELNSGY
jgi:glycosyltransferase involved in cell wall biosynthesis